MKKNFLTKHIQHVLMLVFLVFSLIGTGAGSQSSESISTNGAIKYTPDANVTVNIQKSIGINNLSLGFMLDWQRWATFINSPVCKELAKNASFKLVRVFDFRSANPRLAPCIYWNETSRSGTWSWANVDMFVQGIFSIGAEPLFCLGWARDNIQNYIPPGMAVNPNTSLPYPESFAAYAKEWVRHFNNRGWAVRYYQIMNEPNFYFGWNPSDTTKLAYYVQLWNAAARAMRQENPSVLLSQDCITMKNVFDYWLVHGDDVDFFDFHKYDADVTNQYSDAVMFDRAETRQFETSTSFYGIEEARQKWFNARGKKLIAINSESNFSSAWNGGTEPRIQQMSGAVWLALMLRKAITTGLSYSVYFEFLSPKSWQEAHGTGWGFGMVNEDDNQPWFPYYVQKIIGSNLAVGDRLVETGSSSGDVRCIAWINNGKLDLLLICKANEPRTVAFQGINGRFDFVYIDNSTPSGSSRIQNGTTTADRLMLMNGYTVALLQMTVQ